MKKIKFQVSLTGFIVSLLLVSLFATVFAGFVSELEVNYGVASNVTFEHYNKTSELTSQVNTIRANTTIEQDQGLLDVIGGYFRGGYAALKLTFNSYDTFDSLMSRSETDYPILNIFTNFFALIVLVLLVVGVLISVLVKMRV